MNANALRAAAAALIVGLAATLAGGAGLAMPAAPEDGVTLAVDINRAGVEELTSLPGIGPALAKRIVEHRQKNGPFRKAEELLAVKGIGPKLLGKLRPHLRVSQPPKSG